MNNELSAALWGAVVGAFIGFAGTYFLEIRTFRRKRRQAISLFKFLNKERVGSKENVEDYEILYHIVEQIRPSILDCGCEKIIECFLDYSANLIEASRYIKQRQLGLAGHPINRMDSIYKNFLEHSDNEVCCE